MPGDIFPTSGSALFPNNVQPEPSLANAKGSNSGIYPAQPLRSDSQLQGAQAGDGETTKNVRQQAEQQGNLLTQLIDWFKSLCKDLRGIFSAEVRVPQRDLPAHLDGEAKSTPDEGLQAIREWAMNAKAYRAQQYGEIIDYVENSRKLQALEQEQLRLQEERQAAIEEACQAMERELGKPINLKEIQGVS